MAAFSCPTFPLKAEWKRLFTEKRKSILNSLSIWYTKANWELDLCWLTTALIWQLSITPCKMPSLNTLCVYIHPFSSTPTDSWQRHNERGALESILCTAAVAYSLFSFRLSKMLSLLQWGQVDRWLIHFNGEEKAYFRACIARMDFYDSISDVGMSFGTHFILWWWCSSRHMPGSQKHYKRQVTVVYVKLILSTNNCRTEIPKRVSPYKMNLVNAL